MKNFFGSSLALWLALPVGAALALAFAPFGWWPLAVLAPAYLFFGWHFSVEPKRSAKLGFLFTSGTFLAGTYWLYYSIYGIGKAPIWLTLFLMLALVAIMGGYSAFVGYALARWLRPSAERERSGLARVVSSTGFRYLLVVPAAWVIVEWFRGWFLSGFAWLSLGYSLIDTALAGLAPIGGVYTLSFAAALTAGALVAMTVGDRRNRIAAIAVLAIVWIVGFAFWKRDWTDPAGRPITVAIVQGAVPQTLKWSKEYRDSTLALYRELTLPHLGSDIVLWPEAALPDLPENLGPFLIDLWNRAHAQGSTLMTGLLHYPEGEDRVRNGLLVLNEEPQWYDKRRLVPFGEFFPVPAAVREWMRLRDLPYSDIAPGPRVQPALNAAGQKIAATICYEDAYGSEQLAILQEATLLVNITNDAWFGDSTAAYQHLEISRMRALEAGRPLLRAANDGVSAILDANGAVTQTLPRFEPGVLTGSVQPRTGLTPYARVGNFPLVIACLLILALAAAPSIRRRGS